jgi:hypothetical protein
VPCQVWPAGSATKKNPAWVDDSPFQFAVYSMEGPAIYPFLQVDPNGYRDYKYYATTSFQSDVPLSYYSPELYSLQGPAVDYDNAIHGRASFLANNCNSKSGREEIARACIQQHETSGGIRIDSLSQCLRNGDRPKGVNMKNKSDVLRHYLFHLALENQRSDDYITEKL